MTGAYMNTFKKIAGMVRLRSVRPAFRAVGMSRRRWMAYPGYTRDHVECSAHISQHQESLHNRVDRPIVKHELIRKKEQVGCLFRCIRPTGDAFRVFTVWFAFVVQASTSFVGVAITVRL